MFFFVYDELNKEAPNTYIPLQHSFWKSCAGSSYPQTVVECETMLTVCIEHDTNFLENTLKASNFTIFTLLLELSIFAKHLLTALFATLFNSLTATQKVKNGTRSLLIMFTVVLPDERAGSGSKYSSWTIVRALMARFSGSFSLKKEESGSFSLNSCSFGVRLRFRFKVL